jgi:hypothetical protein
MRGLWASATNDGAASGEREENEEVGDERPPPRPGGGV